jgi:hypothetical protein
MLAVLARETENGMGAQCWSLDDKTKREDAPKKPTKKHYN